MGLNFGDLLSNALHEVKLHTRKKIGIIQDEIGYTFDPPLTGVTIESWRYRKPPSSLPDLEQLATAIIDYGSEAHNEVWLKEFLERGGHPFPDVVCQRLFPTLETVDQPTSNLTAQATNSYPPPPVAAYAPPSLDGFIGRQMEQTFFQGELTDNNLALICGMAGMGKTTLANQLALQIADQSKVFWHPFHDGNLNPFIRRLAGFLANHGRSDLWEMIEAARMAGVKPPDLETSFDTLVAQLDQLDVTLCLDDLQYVDEDPQFAEFFVRLQNSGVRLIVTARRFPSFITGNNLELDGLSLADSRTLLIAREVDLADELSEALHTYTAGNGAFLTLAAVMLRHAMNPADLIAKLAMIDNIERFLMEEVNDRLSANQQRVMEGVAILGGYPGTRDALEEILNQRDVRRTLQELSAQFLLLVGEGEFGREYYQHGIIQSFYYEQPRQRVRRQMHLRAAEFYELEEVDRFKAAFHYGKGDNSERVIDLAVNHLWEIVNQGMARPLADVLDGVQEGNLSQNGLFDLWLTQAQLDTLLGDNENAQEVLQKAAETLQALPVSPHTDLLKARVCLHMAELLERQSPPDALTWAQRGLDVVPRAEEELTAALTIRAGTMMMHMGNLGGALETFEVVDNNLIWENARLQSELTMNFSYVYHQTGQLDLALDHAQKGIDLSRHIRDHLQTCRTYSNLAYIYYLKGDWQKAVGTLEEAMGIAQRLGSQQEILSLSVNLGQFYTDLGNHQLAWKYLDQAIQMSGPQQNHQSMVAKINIGCLLNAEGKFDESLEILDVAESEAKEINDQIGLGTIFIFQAEALAGNLAFENATRCIDKAIDAFKGLGFEENLGIALRVKGEILWASEEIREASEMFEQSHRYLKGVNAYEEAIVNGWRGRAKILDDQIEEGKVLIGKALETFTRIGAKHKVDSIEKYSTGIKI